jgi:hypothetical protein
MIQLLETLPIGQSTGLKVVNPVSVRRVWAFTLGKEFLILKKEEKKEG